jgi:hypothetical protein
LGFFVIFSSHISNLFSLLLSSLSALERLRNLPLISFFLSTFLLA